jgi:hypothetical protein
VSVIGVEDILLKHFKFPISGGKHTVGTPMGILAVRIRRTALVVPPPFSRVYFC